MRRLCTLIAALLFAALATPASAYTIASFSLSGVTFDDVGTASGTFRIVYGSPLEFSPSIMTTPGTTLNGAQYAEGAVQINFIADTEFQFGTASLFPDGTLRLFVHSNLNPVTLASLPTFAISFGTERFSYPLCTSNCPPSLARTVTGGSIVTTGLETFPEPAPTPLPAALPLLVSALGGMGVIGWRHRRSIV